MVYKSVYAIVGLLSLFPTYCSQREAVLTYVVNKVRAVVVALPFLVHLMRLRTGSCEKAAAAEKEREEPNGDARNVLHNKGWRLGLPLGTK